jgi:hypothetical protein
LGSTLATVLTSCRLKNTSLRIGAISDFIGFILD